MAETATKIEERSADAPRPLPPSASSDASSAERRKREQDFTLFRSVARKVFGETPAEAGHQRMTARSSYTVAIGGDEALALPEAGGAARARPTLAWSDATAPNARTVEVFYGERAIASRAKLADERLRAAWSNVTERGAALLYAQGEDGVVSVYLYPAEASSMKAEEDALLLARRRNLEAMTGRGALESHWRAFRAYAEVTSLAGEPSLWQRALVLWLRATRPALVDGRRRAAPARSPAAALLAAAAFGAALVASL
ncbi:MAG: hypothetical protein AAGM38_08170 [Pseudomonadota bacterium]